MMNGAMSGPFNGGPAGSGPGGISPATLAAMRGMSPDMLASLGVNPEKLAAMMGGASQAMPEMSQAMPETQMPEAANDLGQMVRPKPMAVGAQPGGYGSPPLVDPQMRPPLQGAPVMGGAMPPPGAPPMNAPMPASRPPVMEGRPMLQTRPMTRPAMKPDGQEFVKYMRRYRSPKRQAFERQNQTNSPA